MISPQIKGFNYGNVIKFVRKVVTNVEDSKGMRGSTIEFWNSFTEVKATHVISKDFTDNSIEVLLIYEIKS